MAKRSWSHGVPWAYKRFHRNTLEEAVRVFGDNDLSDLEDLLCMPSRVFGFYFRAYLKYLTTTGAINDSDDVTRLISLIQFKAENKRDDLRPLWGEVEPILKKIVEQQSDSPEEWTPEGSFCARIHEIVKLGFDVTFDTSKPDIVPDFLTLKNVAGLGGSDVSFPVAVQIFHNSGIDHIDTASSKHDILRIFGTPDAIGGAQLGIWSASRLDPYDRLDSVVHFHFDGDAVTRVTFISCS